MKPTNEVTIKKEVLEHPASTAWDKFCSGQKPVSIEVLKQTERHSVYCLKGVGINGSDVVAKRLSLEAASIEQKIYEDIIPNLPLSSLRYYGRLDNVDSVWIFREYVNGNNFSPFLMKHRQLAAQWLATLHTSATMLENIRQLTDRGPNYYKERLILARQRILRNISNSWINSKHIIILRKILKLMDLIEAEWKQINHICSEMPSTIVQGDFVAKNLHIQVDHESSRLVCLDWDHAGFGVPAVDLHGWRSNPDLLTYSNEIKKAGWKFDINAIDVLASVGNLFRCIAAIHWESESLAFPWIEKPMGLIQSYQLNLSKTIERFKKNNII